MDTIDWKRSAAVLFCLLAGLVLAYGIVRYALPVLLPFLLAWGVALLIRPAAIHLARRSKISQKWWAAILVLLALLLVFSLLWVVGNRLVYEWQRLMTRLTQNWDGVGALMEKAFDAVADLTSRIPLPDRLKQDESFQAFWREMDDMLMTMLGEALSALSARVPTLVASFLKTLPGALLFVGVSVIACFYFCMDGDAFLEGITARLPRRWQSALPGLSRRLRYAAGRYARAYVLILLLTFCEVFIGLVILRVDYAFLLALLTALVDVLPILGAGAVLLPWAVVALLLKKYYLGFGLLILYAVVSVVRQIAEPKIVGESLGLHPLAALISLYVGFRVFGLWGMLLGPGMAMLIKTGFERREET